LQNEKTKLDANSLGRDIKSHANIAAEKVGIGAHKAGVATGVSEPTMGEKIGKGIEKTVDLATGNRKVV
jgi:hypothetical protein